MASSIHPLSDLSTPGHLPGSGATPEAYDQTKRRVQTVRTSWEDFLSKLTGQLDQQERSFDRIKYQEGIYNQRYYDGDYFWRFSEHTGLVRDLPHTDEDPFFPHNWFRYFTDLSISSALEASPDIVIDPAGDDDHNVYTARAAQQLADYAEIELLTEEFKLESEKTRQLYSGVWWYSYFSLDAGNLYASRPVFKEVTKQLAQSAFICGCGNMGPLERLTQGPLGPRCPDCGRVDQLTQIDGPKATIHEIVEYKKVPVGFPTIDCVSPLQMHGDRRAGHYLRGNWLCRGRLVDGDTVAEKIPWWDPDKAGKGSGTDDYGIKAQEEARRPAGSATKTVGSGEKETTDVPVYQWWFRPAKYAHIQFDHDIEFIGGQKTKIPAFTPIGEVFPKGLYQLKVGTQWVDHDEQDFRKHWAYIPYVYSPHKADGSSTITDMQEPQREMIEVRSLLFLYLKARSGGAPTIIQSPLSETDFDGSPATITRLPQGSPDISKLMHQPQFPPADPNLTQYANQMSGEMQIMAQVVSPTTTGDPSAQEMGGTDTARGMMIMNAKAQGLQGPKLMPLAYGQAQAVKQWIEMFRENVVDDVPIPLKGEKGSREWIQLSGADLEGDFVVYPRPKSWLPHPREEKQSALQNAFTLFGQVLMAPGNTELKKLIIEVYGLDLDLDDYNQEARDAMLRIDQMTEMIPQAKQLVEQQLMQNPQSAIDEQGQPIDPSQFIAELVAKMVPIDPDMDDPEPYMEYFKKWLRGDQGRDADPLLQSSVRVQWGQYRQMAEEAQKAMMKAQADMQGEVEKQKGAIQSELEKEKHGYRMEEAKVKGHMDAATAAAAPQEIPAPTPEPEDTAVRDHILAKDAEEHKHVNRLREMMAKGAIDHALRPPPAMPGTGLPGAGTSHAGVGGSLVEGAPNVPALGGLPSQPAI